MVIQHLTEKGVLFPSWPFRPPPSSFSMHPMKIPWVLKGSSKPQLLNKPPLSTPALTNVLLWVPTVFVCSVTPNNHYAIDIGTHHSTLPPNTSEHLWNGYLSSQHCAGMIYHANAVSSCHQLGDSNWMRYSTSLLEFHSLIHYILIQFWSLSLKLTQGFQLRKLSQAKSLFPKDSQHYNFLLLNALCCIKDRAPVSDTSFGASVIWSAA